MGSCSWHLACDASIERVSPCRFLQAVILPPLPEMFRLAQPHVADLAALALARALMVAWVELVKVFDLRMSRRATAGKRT